MFISYKVKNETERYTDNEYPKGVMIGYATPPFYGVSQGKVPHSLLRVRPHPQR